MGKAKLPWVRRFRVKSGYRYRAVRTIDGVRRRGKLRGSDSEAHADAIALAKESVAAPGARVSFGEAIAAVRDELKTKRAPGTLQWFEQQVVPLTQMWRPELPLERITQGGIELFMRGRMFPRQDVKEPERPVSAATVRHNLLALSRILRLAQRRGTLSDNPLANVDLPRVERRAMDFFTPREVGTILRKIRESEFPAREEHADMVELLFLTGLRRNELVRLTTGDVDLKRRTLYVRGKNRTREMPITNRRLRQVLARMLLRVGDGEPLIRGGEEVVKTAFRRWAGRLKDRRLHPHALKHSFATALIDAGVDVHTVALLLGHSGLQMVMRYLHARGKAMRDAMTAVARSGAPRTRGSPRPSKRRDAAPDAQSMRPAPSDARDTSAG